jgi:hypothetical protein
MSNQQPRFRQALWHARRGGVVKAAYTPDQLIDGYHIMMRAPRTLYLRLYSDHEMIILADITACNS